MLVSTSVRTRLLTTVRVLPATMVLVGALSFAPGAGALQTDSDLDGLFDEDEIGYYLTNPNNPDSDGDGLSDGEEVYYATDPLVANAAPARQDTDGDGLYDQDETAVYGTDVNLSDTDGDGVSDGTEVYNSTDPLAGTAPAAEPAPAGEAAPVGDPAPAAEPAPATTYDPNADYDQDGLPDHQEGTAYATDPTVFDTDMDGLSDGFEVSVSRTDPLLYDTFGHGSSDAQTYQAKIAHQGPGNDPVEDAPMSPSLPAEGNPCQIEGACGGGDVHNPEEGPLHQHCFLEDQMDPNRTGYCGNV